ncbi:MAG: DNA polymerase I [Melioribacteraceae bacterium]|nr:DNA polymerase I [Melioribacteraceae bacterium]
MNSNKTFVIIDAMALAYKGYFAFINRPLKNAKGEPTSAVFGFLNQLFKIIEDTNPNYIAVAFDTKEKTFRHERYEKYKSSRQEMPEDMIPQISRIREIIEAFNIPLYMVPGYEADDLIGTAVKRAEKEGYSSYAITPDKDYIQLITNNIRVVKPGKSTDEIVILDEKKVKEDFGFEPIQMIDYLALIGDSSDDIPGVAGIGPKSATPLIQEFGSIEGIYNNLDKIEKKGIRTKLEDGKDNAFLSKELATIICDVPFDFDLKDTVFETPNTEKLLKIFAELEFKVMAKKLDSIINKHFNSVINVEEVYEEQVSSDNFNTEKVKYKLITSKKDADIIASKLSKVDLFVFDTETDSLNMNELNIAGASFCIKPGEAYFIAINPLKSNNDLFSADLSNRLPIEDFIKIFKPIFENEKIKKVCQNGKYDIGVLRNYGIEVNSFYFDTMLASYVLDPDQKHGMDDLSEKYLNYKPIPIIDIIGSYKTPEKIFEADLDKLSNYASEDADITYQLYEVLDKELKNNSLEKLAFEVEFPLVEVLEDMEREGINLDIDSMREFSKELEGYLNKLTKDIFAQAGEEFNINSTKQLQNILFDKLKLPPTKKTKTGYSTDARSLEYLQNQHEIIDHLLNYRQIQKLKSTYADALPNLINPKTGRIHTTFNQTVASTGRLSSIDPNLQNIPIRTEMGKEIRKAFVPRDKNHTILSADYSQIELRIMASICSDENMINAFKNNEDIHRSTAALVFKVKPEEVTSDQRRKAKEVNFGILYGIGPFGLKTRLGITQNEAKNVIDTYFGTFKNVKKFIDDAIINAREKGFAETLLGRRRFLPNINSNNQMLRSSAERIAINMPIQGTAADMIKLAMINIYKEMKKQKFKSKMILQVHDELLFDARKDELEDLKPLVKELMENALKLDVPITVEMGTGENWLDAH